ncbi:hypothetical protein EON65_09360 [archaeon]|nr:MAG: hypothetical protein EON65_09360 [archaeon]
MLYFFHRAALEQQIKQIKKGSESRLDFLKKEVVQVESELEEVRYEASFAGVQSSKEHKKQLAEKQQKLRQIKEKTEAMEQLAQKAVAGLAHISDILFIPKSEEDAAVLNLVREIEAVLDTLINEREKQLQQQQGGNVVNRDNSTVIAETHANRSPELDFAIAKHESPKVRLPKQLPSRPLTDAVVVSSQQGEREDEEQEEEGPWERNYVKTASLQSLRTGLKKSGRTNKQVLSATM